MASIETTPNADPSNGASPLARALAAQAAAQFDDLAKARGLDASTFSALADRAEALDSELAAWGAGDGARARIRSHRGILRDVASLLADPSAKAIPPSNDRIYAAVLDITELAPIVRTLATSKSGRDAVLHHLDEPDAARAHADRLALSFASICKRGGLDVTPPTAAGEPARIQVDRWRIAAVPAVPLRADGLGEALGGAAKILEDCKRPGLIILEAGPLLDWQPITVAEDGTATGIMNERLDAFMMGARTTAIETIGTDLAFGLVVHATLPATNVVSRRMLFAECLRAVNLCDTSDPRADGFRSIAHAMTRSV